MACSRCKRPGLRGAAHLPLLTSWPTVPAGAARDPGVALKGFSAQMQEVPEALGGRHGAMTHPAVIARLAPGRDHASFLPLQAKADELTSGARRAPITGATARWLSGARALASAPAA